MSPTFAAYSRYIVTAESRASYTLGPLPGVALAVRPLGIVNKPWIAWMNEWRLRGGDLDAALADPKGCAEFAAQLADFGVVGWSGLVEDGAELAYSLDTARALLAWLASNAPEEVKLLLVFLSSLDNFRPAGTPPLKEAEEVAKNS